MNTGRNRRVREKLVVGFESVVMMFMEKGFRRSNCGQ
jgi:hypothetical protein